MNSLQRIALGVEYDGTDYYGWQIQAQSPTVQEVLQQALEKLPEKDRKVIAYRQIMKLSAAETGELLNMQANAVNVLFHRAQQRLEKVLKEMAYFG